MTSHTLTRSVHRRTAPAALPFLGDLGLPLARVHEICGDARRFGAALIAARCQGPVVWIVPDWTPERLNPEAAAQIFDPGRLTFLEPKRAEDLLWSMEEVLRSGAVPLVVADIPAPPALTPVRRLHLAAETGAAEGSCRPLGLLLTPGRGGAQGIETRWRMDARHGTEQTGAVARRAWQLDRLRARTEPPKSWLVTPAGGQFRLAPLAEAVDFD